MPLELVGQEQEIGATGVKLFGKTLFNSEDINPDFHGQNGTRIYAEMENDPDVSSATFRFTAPILTSEATIEPWDESDEAEDWAQFCREQILCDGTYWQAVGDTWQNRLEHILLMLTYGFSPFEIVWGTDSEGRRVFAKMIPLLHTTVQEFHVDGRGNLSELLQRAWHPSEGFKTAIIPLEKLSVFTFRGRGFNYWGRPIIRSAYKPYYHKHGIEKLDGIALERNAVGFTWVKLPEGASEKQRNDAEKLAYEARAHERQGAVTEGDVEIEILYPTGNDPKRVESMKYYAQQIHANTMAEWTTLGATESGSRAVAGSKMDYALMAYQGTCDTIAETINRQWIVPLMKRNRVGDQFPRFKFQDLSEMSGEKLAAILPPLVEKKILTAGPNTEIYVREMLDLPEEERPEWMDAAPVPAKPFGEGTEPDSEGGEGRGPGPSESEEPEDKAAAAGPSVAVPTRLRRALKAHEMHLSAEEMAEYLDTEPSRIWYRVVKPLRDQQIAAIAEYASKLPVAVLARGVYGRGDDRPKEKKMSQELGAALLGVYRHGRQAVVGETKRQRSVQKQDEMDEDDELAVTPAQTSWIKRLADGFAAISVASLLSEAVRAGLGAHQRDLPQPQVEAEIRRALTDLSEPRVMADLGGLTAQSFTTGRNDQLVSMAEEFGTYYYSAVMDQGTCEPCGALDGEEHEAGNPTFQTPNPNCEGGIGRCRCITIGIVREEAVA